MRNQKDKVSLTKTTIGVKFIWSLCNLPLPECRNGETKVMIIYPYEYYRMPTICT